MKRYKLLKDLPFAKAGEILELWSDGTMVFVDSPSLPKFNKKDVEMFPLWFEEINTSWITYWYVTDLGQIFRASVHASRKDNPIINANRKIGNYFQTEEEAEKHLEWLKARAVLIQDTKGFKPDWNDEDEWKYCVYYNNNDSTFGVGSMCYINDGKIYFETKEDAENSIKTHKKEWKIYLGVD